MVRRIIPTRLLSSSSSSSISKHRPETQAQNNSHSDNRSNGSQRRGLMRSKTADGALPAGSLSNSLILKVVVLKARSLAAKDRSGTSDPYIVLMLGDARAVTHAVPKTLDPEWNVIEELPVNSVNSLILDVICWDKDRFGKDYLGEFDLALEEIFQNGKAEQEPKWYSLRSKRPGKKTSNVSGEVMLQFTLLDDGNPEAPSEQVIEKLSNLVSTISEGSKQVTPSMTPILSASTGAKTGTTMYSNESSNLEDIDELDLDSDTPEDTEDGAKAETSEGRKRRLRIKGLRKQRRKNQYAFVNGGSDVVGLIFLEIIKITDLPPESNMTHTSFDMDPFVVASLGKKTYKTQRVRHSLNPVYNEKMLFQVLNHEQQYSFAFTVIDHDKYSGNDFIASANLPVRELIEKSPKANPETGLYELPELPAYSPQVSNRSRIKRIGLSRTSSSQSITKMMRPGLNKTVSSTNTQSQSVSPDTNTQASTKSSQLTALDTSGGAGNDIADPISDIPEDPDFHDYQIPLKLKNLDKWEAKHKPVVYVRAKYMPYPALRQQFWRALLKQYDTDESGHISRVELTTMLDSLGSTLSENTIDSFFQRYPREDSDGDWELSMNEAVTCLEDQLESKNKASSVGDKLRDLKSGMKDLLKDRTSHAETDASSASTPTAIGESQASTAGMSDLQTPSAESGDPLSRTDTEEHVVEIRECPICHQPRLNKRNDTDIITHIATCASQDWRKVNTVLMGGFVTASQAQRKWYSKVITKISYGGYKLGANSANILVQDRLTGQINEEKMSVYVRLGIRLLYKGLKSRDMENRRIRKLLKNLSIKQGKKFDDPTSRDEIEKFIEFHGLDISEILLPLDQYKNFNEFFYRALKPGARPCSAPDRPEIIVSPADCRSVVFNEITQATSVWVKGREFNLKRLLGDAYPEDAARYEGGALGIFRLAPQDYHRFHIPVDGIMGEPKTIAGEYYTVNPMAIRSTLDVYGENVRVLVPINSEKHGRVMVVCVGAMMVGSTVITRNEGEHVRRAEELGYFQFGGSTILLLFEPGQMRWDDDLTDNSSTALETLIRVGMSVGHSPQAKSHVPDMRKNAEDITDAEKREARRRIQGNFAHQDSADGSEEDFYPRKMSTTPTINTFAASAM